MLHSRGLVFNINYSIQHDSFVYPQSNGCPVDTSVEGKTPSNECPVYDTKESDGE